MDGSPETAEPRRQVFMIGPRYMETIAARVRLSTPFTHVDYLPRPWTSNSMEESRHVGH